ncbi:MAG TPA: BamA/TamA family outer membrane protein [Bryobacteraceae bacterium]|nr:BamA/TamA family outer membrane protein [Bryobacteraceae bacterium]
MKLLILIALLTAAAAFGRENTSTSNVNARYTIERIEYDDPIVSRITRSLRSEIDSLIGQKFDPQIVSDFSAKIKNQVNRRISHKIERGAQPEHVRLVFSAEGPRIDEDNAQVTKLKYHHKQGWTGGVGTGFDLHGNRIEFGVQTDADQLLERYAGLNAAVSRQLGERVRARIDFEAFHQQWNPATLLEVESRQDIPGIYRERFSVEPSVIVTLAEPLTLTAGVSFQQLQIQFPVARFQSANAIDTTLRYKTRWRQSDTIGQELDTGYSLRAAANLLGSDFVYTRHLVHANYALRQDENLIMLRFLAGSLNGNAPLFDRFSIGNATTLRGWHKFDIDPLGGNRMVHGSVAYRYRAVGFFYDAGAVWENRKEPADDKHSVGVTLALGALRDGPYVTMAFPLRSGAIQPLFMMGMNF